MRRFFGRRRLVFLTVLAVAAAVAVGGYAYFSTTGSGSGSATVGSNTALTITQTNTISGLVPGGSAKSVEYSIDNTAGNGVQNLGKVTISNIAIDSSHATAGCQASWFSANAPSTAVGTIADGGTFDSTSDATTEPSIQMDDSGTNQDSCKGATVSFDLSA
jgi:hypothetical protein